MGYCSNCGERNDDQSEFCKNCGEILKATYNPGKPLKSRIESLIEENFSENMEYIPEEEPYQVAAEVEGEGIIEWDVIFGASLILVILAGILLRILPSIATWIAVFMSLVYVLIFSRRKSTLIISFPLALIIAAVIWAFFSL